MSDKAVKNLLGYLDRSVTPGHAAAEAASVLAARGFVSLPESSRWDELPARFTVARGTGTIAAVIPGARPPEETGFRILCAHTDFPSLRLKPSPVRESEGCRVLGVEIYGGPILATWFDRDLSIAGTAVRRLAGDLVQVPYDLRRPVCRLATPALHLNRGVNEEGFSFNKEENICPILGLLPASFDLAAEIGRAADGDGQAPLAFSGHLYDTQRASLGGADGEFVFSGRLDNLAMCHAALEAVKDIEPGESTAVVCLFDSEEAGSGTASGAGSTFLDDILERLCASSGREGLFRSRARSMMVSADGAHAVHPCYASKHERANRPVLNGGPVVKVNAQERYASSALSQAYFAECASAAGVRCQTFVSRNDIPCGSTIGPILSTRLGMAAVDVGDPMLSMHSVREMAGTADHPGMIAAMKAHLSGIIRL